MASVYTTGEWFAKDGEEDAFVDAWAEFAAWAASQPGAGTLRLTRDLSSPARFVSFGEWETLDQVHAWKSSPDFRERMGRVQQHVAAFHPAELAEVRAAGHMTTA